MGLDDGQALACGSDANGQCTLPDTGRRKVVKFATDQIGAAALVLTLTGQATPEGEIEVTATRLSGEVAALATLPCHEKLKHLAVVLARDLDLPPYKFKLVVDGVLLPP